MQPPPSRPRRALALGLAGGWAGALSSLPALGLSAPNLADDPASDAPAPRAIEPPRTTDPADYAQALQRWREPQDIEDWVGRRFRYDSRRAMALSETARAQSAAPAIHLPAAFFEQPDGICVDLARFVVETLRAVAPLLQARYLMIEFDPALRAGQVLRRHWIASFRRDAAVWLCADSKRPGTISGPYPSIGAFAAEYGTWRQRRIVAVEERDSFQRRLRAARPGQRSGASTPTP